MTPKNEVAEIQSQLLHELIGAAGEVALITSTQDSRIVRLGMAWRKWRNAGGKINPEPEPSSPSVAQEYVMVADGEGAACEIVVGNVHEALHRFMCACGRSWIECETPQITEDIRQIADPDAWSHDEDGEPFSVDWHHETGRVALYRLKSLAPTQPQPSVELREAESAAERNCELLDKWKERAETAEQQLAEARAQGMREAAEIARERCRFLNKDAAFASRQGSQEGRERYESLARIAEGVAELIERAAAEPRAGRDLEGTK